MADISAILDGIVTRLQTITSLQYRSSAYGKDFVDPPWAIVVPDTGLFISFDSTLGRGSDDMNFVIKVIVGAADDRANQDALTAYLDTSGASSVKAAVDGSLGGVVSFATVRSARSYGEVQWAGMIHNGVEFDVEVTT